MTSKTDAKRRVVLPAAPLPDFFMGAHAEIMDWPLATADVRRFETNFPKLELRTP